MQLLLVLTLIVGLTVVQSVFGIGLLLFGTPLFLLLGYGFTETLALLLPCSLAVSAIQAARAWRQLELRGDYLRYCLPAVFLALGWVLLRAPGFNLRLGVGVLMLGTGLLRASPRARARVQGVCRQWRRSALTAIGLLHGLTNMGGGLLSVFVGSLGWEKAATRGNIACGYLLMAACQLAVLAALHPQAFHAANWPLPLLSAATYWLLGERVFTAASETGFQGSLTVFIALIGAALLIP